MAILSTSSCSSRSLGLGANRGDDLRKILGEAQKTQSIWGKIYGVVLGVPVRVVHVARSSIGSVVRDVFFFPLKCPLIIKMLGLQEQLEIEKKYCQDFWDPLKPLDPNFKDQAEIREKFAPPEDKIFKIQLKDGKTVEITCRIMQTKAGGQYYNFVHVPGIYATISNTVGTIYPYLAAYLNFEKKGMPSPSARFIIISENNLNFKPASLDEAGFVLLETLKALRAEFGDIDQLVAHSLGNVFFTDVLNQIDDPKILPKHICLDRAPASIWEASKKYFWGFGRLIYLLAKVGGWSLDLEQDVVRFCQRWKERPSLLVTGVKQDRYFSGSANLCLREKIKKITEIQRLFFSPPLQIISFFGQHNMSSDLLNRCYLMEKSDFMEYLEKLPEAIIRHSLPFKELQQSA